MGVKRVKRCAFLVGVVGDFGSPKPALHSRFPALAVAHIMSRFVQAVDSPAQLRTGHVLHGEGDKQPFIGHAVPADLLAVRFGHDFPGLTAHL